MRRVLITTAALLSLALVVGWPASGDDDGPYKVRGYFDNGSFLVPGEEVRIAGATVGLIDEVEVSRDDELASVADCPPGAPSLDCATRVPGKAVIVMEIDDDGFKEFRQDASCLIRPQSLIGERFVDCTPTQPHAPTSEPPPELEEIPDGEYGEGQRFLPLESNGKSVDIDLVNNIQRAPYRDRFRLIFNELGAALAARGDDLAAIVDRANPALRQTNRVVGILAEQNRKLANLASDGDAVLEPLARERSSITGFFRNAGVAGAASAERRDDIEEGLAKFPETLRQLRLTMRDLKGFADQGTPLSADINASAPYVNKATQKLAPFARNGIPALQSLGDAAEASGPKLVASDGLLVDMVKFAEGSVPVGTNLKGLLDTFVKTNGTKYLMEFIYNSVGSINGFDGYGHFLRSYLLASNCINVEPIVVQGCEAFWRGSNAPAPAAPKKKKKKKKGKSARLRPAQPAPAQPVPALPPLTPIPEAEEEPPTETTPEDEEPPPGDEETDPEAADPANSTDTAKTARYKGSTPRSRAQSMAEAALMLEFLLGGQS